MWPLPVLSAGRGQKEVQVGASSYFARTPNPWETRKTVGKQKTAAGQTPASKTSDQSLLCQGQRLQTDRQNTGPPPALVRTLGATCRASATYLFLAGPAPRLSSQCLSPARFVWAQERGLSIVRLHLYSV